MFELRVSPQGTPRDEVLGRMHLAEALRERGRHAEAVQVLAPLVEPSASPGPFALERAAAWVEQIRSLLALGEIDRARALYLRAQEMETAVGEAPCAWTVELDEVHVRMALADDDPQQARAALRRAQACKDPSWPVRRRQQSALTLYEGFQPPPSSLGRK